MTQPNLRRDYERAAASLRGNLAALAILADVTVTVCRDEFTNRAAMHAFLDGISRLRRLIDRSGTPVLSPAAIQQVTEELELRAPRARPVFVDALRALRPNPIAAGLFLYAMWSAAMDDATEAAELEHIARSGAANARNPPTRAALDAGRPTVLRELDAFAASDVEYEREREAEAAADMAERRAYDEAHRGG